MIQASAIPAERQSEFGKVTVSYIPQSIGYATGQLVAAAEDQLPEVPEVAQLGRGSPH